MVVGVHLIKVLVSFVVGICVLIKLMKESGGRRDGVHFCGEEKMGLIPLRA